MEHHNMNLGLVTLFLGAVSSVISSGQIWSRNSNNSFNSISFLDSSSVIDLSRSIYFFSSCLLKRSNAFLVVASGKCRF